MCNIKNWNKKKITTGFTVTNVTVQITTLKNSDLGACLENGADGHMDRPLRHSSLTLLHDSTKGSMKNFFSSDENTFEQ